MNHPKVSIIIINWNGLADTIECLESLRQITYPNYEVIVVDNGSYGDDAEVLRCRFGDYIHLIKNNRNLGYAGGINVGIKFVQNNNYKADYLLLLNNDIVFAADFLTKIVESALADDSIGMVSPKVYQYGLSTPARQGIIVKIQMLKAGIALIGIKHIKAWQSNNINGGAVDGCCFLIRNDVIEKIGYFDESYFCYWEDVDYLLRVWKAGYKVLCVPESKIWHKVGQTSKKISGFTYYYFYKNEIRCMKKHATKWEYRCFMIYYFLFYFELILVYYLILKLNLQIVLSYFRGVRDGLLNRDTAAKLYGDNRFQG